MRSNLTGIYDVRDGQTVKVEFFFDHAQALEAAGLSDGWPLWTKCGTVAKPWEVQLPRDTKWAMSEENVERVRKGFEAHNRGDLDALVEFYDPDVVFETLLLGTHHGNEAIRLIYEENQKTLSGYDVVPVELIDAGDKVVAVAQTVGSGPISQIVVEDQFAFVFTFAEEHCVREQAFRNKEEALEAAGLSE